MSDNSIIVLSWMSCAVTTAMDVGTSIRRSERFSAVTTTVSTFSPLCAADGVVAGAVDGTVCANDDCDHAMHAVDASKANPSPLETALVFDISMTMEFPFMFFPSLVFDQNWLTFDHEFASTARAACGDRAIGLWGDSDA